MAVEIDRIDRRILQHLQHDARMSNADLAKAVHVSTATCYRRTQRLFQEGYIHTVRAEIVPARVSRGTLVVVGVVLDRSTPESFGAAIRKLPVVLDCYLVAGDFDCFLKMRVRDIADFNKLHGDQLIALPGVRQTRTFFVMNEVVETVRCTFDRRRMRLARAGAGFKRPFLWRCFDKVSDWAFETGWDSPARLCVPALKPFHNTRRAENAC